MVPTFDLVAGIVAAVNVPVIASGGLMDGRDIAKVLKRGAVAAQLGTAFLACPECGAPAAHKKALLAAREDTTLITRAFSGRHARGLRNAFIDAVKPETILPFRQQHDLTRPMRGAAAKQDQPDYLSLWAGRGVMRIRSMPAADLIRTLVAEIASA
jgi:nitronate monooxygenase